MYGLDDCEFTIEIWEPSSDYIYTRWMFIGISQQFFMSIISSLWKEKRINQFFCELCIKQYSKFSYSLYILQLQMCIILLVVLYLFCTSAHR